MERENEPMRLIGRVLAGIAALASGAVLGVVVVAVHVWYGFRRRR